MELEFFNPIPFLKKVVKLFFRGFLKKGPVSVLGVRHPYAQGEKRLAFSWLRTRDRVTKACPAFVPQGGTSSRQAKHTWAERSLSARAGNSGRKHRHGVQKSLKKKMLLIFVLERTPKIPSPVSSFPTTATTSSSFPSLSTSFTW